MNVHLKWVGIRPWIAVASLPLAIAACDGTEIVASELDGVWHSRGYGRVAEIDGNQVRLIEQTDITCLLADTSNIGSLRSRLANTSDLENGRAEIANSATLSTITFERQEGDLAKLCPNGLIDTSDDPELNFEVLWQTFDRHYAFFDQRRIDWQAVYDEVRPTITKDTNSSALARVFESMLERLGDAHVSLYADGDYLVSVGTRLGDKLQRECREQKGSACKVDSYVRDRYRNADHLLKQEYLKGQVTTSLDGEAFWGQLDSKTGYFRLDSMAGLSSDHDYSADSDLEVLEAALDRMLQDIGHLPSMIIDVRFNGGGHDTVSVAIANRFTDQQRLFGSKRPFLKHEEVAPQDLVINPSEQARYDGKVAVLTSSETASAAEVFVMAMRALPEVALIGTATQGILSDELYRTLPNGWELSLSNEIYLTHDQALFEAIGVPPDIEAPFLLAEDLEAGVDQGIETALEILQGNEDAGDKSH